MKTAVPVALSAALLLAAGGVAGNAPKDLKLLQGTWHRVVVEIDGKKPSAEVMAKDKLTITGDHYTLHMGEQARKGTFKLDPGKTPKQLDIVSAEGPNKGKVLVAIYKVEGDTFTYCVALPGNRRPAEFSGAEGSGQALYVNKRAKP
jgi:uncharacterized protein (TIGR03067 family)